jgi:PilZ domain-containing protein
MHAIRTETRIEAQTPAAATILGHPDVRVACQIRDISKSGMCIGVKERIASGKIVKVEWKDHFLVGRVQRVAVKDTDFVVGLELLYCSKWNEPQASALAGAAKTI